MPTLWFSYSTLYGLDAPEPPNSPYSLTWNLGRFLRAQAAARGYAFEYRNLDSDQADTIGPEDIVIGHTWHPNGWLNRALDSAAKVKFILQPYSPGMVAPTERGWIKALFAKADHLFLVTGPAWWQTMPDGPFAEWQEKATRLDMAISPTLHPFSKTTWNPPGKRALLAIGSDVSVKGLDQIAHLARIGGFKLGYFGAAPASVFQHVPQMGYFGGVDFTPDVQARITREFDGFLSLATMDANPTTLLETACWGLLPFCNAESGYLPDAPFAALCSDDPLFNLEQMDWFQQAPDYALRQRAERIRREVVERHTWARFCETVWAEVERWL